MPSQSAKPQRRAVWPSATPTPSKPPKSNTDETAILTNPASTTKSRPHIQKTPATAQVDKHPTINTRSTQSSRVGTHHESVSRKNPTTSSHKNSQNVYQGALIYDQKAPVRYLAKIKFSYYVLVTFGGMLIFATLISLALFAWLAAVFLLLFGMGFFFAAEYCWNNSFKSLEICENGFVVIRRNKKRQFFLGNK